ncbi:MAG TPA: hypothetical protein VNX68_05530 [Nitrosopumilaceae archaeon]|jgi:hypothetical protein|nr:hypothetical protein [Nitrosopumilaceae archaeon]
MKLIYFGVELDATKEREILSGGKFGLNVTVTYKKDSWMSKHEGHQVVDFYNNCTEVHNLYSDAITKNRIAFESDIHSTGCNRDIEDIESVNIQVANKKEATF